MRKRLLILFSLLIVSSLLLTSCWNYREINQLNIVAGVAIDKAEDGDYLITMETVNMHESSGKESKMKSVLIETKGKTIIDAARNALNTNSPKFYWGHATIAIISQEVASEGIVGIIDFLSRDAEPRLSMDLLVSQKETAKEILSAKTLTAVIKSSEITDLMDDQKFLSKALQIQVHDFLKALSAEGMSAIATAITTTEINGEKVFDLSGTAVFKSDKLLGFLNSDETKSLDFVLDEIKGGVLVVKDGSEENDGDEYIALEIHDSSTKMKPIYSDNKLSIQIDIKTKVALAEYTGKSTFDDEEGRKALKKAAEEQLKKEIESLIKKVQNDFNSDIFGFGNSVYQNLPNVWKKQGKDWNTLFKNLEVSVNPTIDIHNSGLLRKQIKGGD